MTDSPSTQSSAAADQDGVRYVSGAVPAADDVRALYDSVQWSAYTQDMDTLMGGLQDILVAPGHQRRGIASELLRRVFAPFGQVRQHVLITDTEQRQRAFYESHGFRESRDVEGGELRAFVRVTPQGG
ncbi:GNAT family N-acetyltransferase [Micrococcus lylae]|uniref:GNAT family N-acetyltransferase n=1 Tax=Micrococcus lylae TaxID=1273 RepID=UPI000C7F8BD6|nr:GNAT family N-acetyltransferase [Micrococcus lylae]WIK82629.1 GNAT family N-acetyltransferase [Micrococcus lylae]